MTYPVQYLIEGHGEPICASPNDQAQKALNLMIEHDFSQLPVIDVEKRPVGLVTHQSILRAHASFGLPVDQFLVADAIVKIAKSDIYNPEDDLFELLDRLRDTSAVLIVDREGKLIGIVTSYDAMEYFRRRAEDMMLVEDVEGMVKDLVLAAFTDQSGGINQEELAAAVDKVTGSRHELRGRYRQALRYYLQLQGQGKPTVNREWFEESFSRLAPPDTPKPFDDLTLYEYTELLLHKERWSLYWDIFNLEAEAIRRLLDKVRETRNALAHFRGDVSSTRRDELKFCAEWLAQHPAEELLEHLVGIPVDWSSAEIGMSGERLSVREKGPAYETLAETDSAIVLTEEVLGPDDSRYAPLAIWLQSRPLDRDRVRITFREVEEIIGGLLPASARKHRAWWANDPGGHVQSQQWLDAGWRVAQVNITEERVVFARIKEREKAYIRFFSALQTDVRKKTDFPLKNIWPDGQSWMTAAGLPEGGPQCLFFAYAFARKARFRVQLYIDTLEQEKNKRIFDRLYEDRGRFEAALDEPISWERLSEKRASWIAIYHPGSITDDDEALSELHAWAVDAMVRFFETFAEPSVQALNSAEQRDD
jgi:CBS domain-containing protein